MKKILYVLIIGGIGGVLLNNLVLPFFIETNFLNSANFFKIIVKAPAQTVIKETERVVVVEPDFWKNIVPQAEKSVTLAQFFSSAGALISQTNGIVLTNDGLVIVPLNAVPRNLSAIQIFAAGKILKGTLATFDSSNNLALIKVEGADLPILDFTDLGGLVLGQNVLVIGKKIPVNQIQTFAHTSLISEIAGQIFFLDLERGQQRGPISGGLAVDSKGKMVGMIQLNNQGQIFIISHNFFRALLDKYLNSK